MSQFTADDADPAEVRSALATLVATEPPLPSGTDDIERRGRTRLARRRVGTGMAAGVVAVVAASLALTSLGGLGGGSAPVAAPPAVDSPSGVVDGGAAGGAQLPTGYPIGEAVNAVSTALPDALTVGEVPMDIGWRDGGQLALPLVGATGNATLTVAIADGACTATVSPAEALAPADLDAVAGAVCASWVAGGSLPIVPAGQPGPEQPDLAHQ